MRGWQEAPDVNFLEHVAAAKIQLRVKELFQRRRLRSAHPGMDPSFGESLGPIARAAG